MTKPFRFGIQLSSLPADGWQDKVRRIESLGFSSIHLPDHFSDQWDPTVGITAIACATDDLRVGTLVYDVDYRHPVVMAKQAATVHLMSGGRHEFGLGAGWMKSDYEEAGIAYDAPGVRISRLDEALQIIRSMWTQKLTTFRGEHYTITEVAQAADLADGEHPEILIGGGGRRVLRLAGRHADIVGINPSLHEGQVTPQTAADLAPGRVREKIDWVHEGAADAGRDPTAIELNSLVFMVGIVDDATAMREGVAQMTGMSADEVADCPLFLTGSPTEIQEGLQKRRAETGISYIVIQADNDNLLTQIAENIVAPLAGT